MSERPLTEAEADLLREALVDQLQAAAREVCSALEESPQEPHQIDDAVAHARRAGELADLIETRLGSESVPGGGPLLRAA